MQNWDLINPGQVIIFEHNFGNAYDAHIGVFTCPKSGLYFFTFRITTNAAKYTETKLVSNGSPITYCISGVHGSTGSDAS